MNRQTIAVEHVTLMTEVDFDTVRSRLESAVPPLDPAIIPILERGDAAAADERQRTGPPLYIMSVGDHGSILAVAGRPTKALQHVIGNPLTAVRMTRYDIRAGLYAPLRVLLYELEGGGTAADYDLPSTLFGQFGIDAVRAVALELDGHLRAALTDAMAVASDPA